MTLAQLAAISGVSARSITTFENGHKRPSAETLKALAEALEFPLSFFRGDPIDDIPLDSVSFRALSKISALDREAALGSLQIAKLINQWLERHFKLPSAQVPSLPHLDPEEAAERVRAGWGLGEAPAPNMVHLLEANGVRVFSLALDCDSVDAFSSWSDRPFVLLSTSKTAERSRFDAAHELGHLVLHRGCSTSHGPEAEDQANVFASAFLMPRAGVLAQGLYDATPDKILVAKRKWRVSAMALTYRVYSMGLLSEWKYKNVAKRLSQMGYRRGEPGGHVVRESSQLLSKVFTSLRHDGKVLALSRDLDLTNHELNNYVFGLVPIAIEGGKEPSAAPRPSLRLVGSSL